MAIVIRNGVQLPVSNKAKSEERIALEALEIGESFEFYPGKKTTVIMATQTILARTGKRFAVRGLEVWRIA